MEASADYSKWYLGIAALAALSALVSATATVVLARLTVRLTRATETYAALVREELALQWAQAEGPLLFGVELWASSENFFARCRHLGFANSLPVLIKKLELQLAKVEETGIPIATEPYTFEDYLKPGKTWVKQLGSDVARKLLSLPKPGFWAGFFGTGPKEQKVGFLTARLEFERAGRPQEIVKEYAVWTHWSGTPRLKASAP